MSLDKKLTTMIALLEEMLGVLKATAGETLTEEEAARILGLSPRYLQALREAGKISFISIGGGEYRHGKVKIVIEL